METWANDEIRESELVIDGYEIYSGSPGKEGRRCDLIHKIFIMVSYTIESYEHRL